MTPETERLVFIADQLISRLPRSKWEEAYTELAYVFKLCADATHAGYVEPPCVPEQRS